MDTRPADDPQTPTRRRALSALAAAFLWPGPGACQSPPLREMRHLFGSPAEVMVRQTQGEPAAAAAMGGVMAGLAQLNRDWNAWKPGALRDLNLALRDGRGWAVAPELLALLRLARALEARSSGLFNVGMGGLVGAWGFHNDVMQPGMPPSAAQLQAWRDPVPSLAQLRVERGRVFSTDRRLQLDLGAIGKGWAIDRALDQLELQGHHHAVVNLGGNLGTRGHAGDRPWLIGIRDPLEGGVMARVATRGREAVVTSGSYERFRLLDGRRMSHIIDPRMAVPTEAMLSVTVLHRSAALADAAATALMVAGHRLWPAVARRMGVQEVLAIESDGRGAMTAAMGARLRFDDGRWASRLKVIA